MGAIRNSRMSNRRAGPSGGGSGIEQNLHGAVAAIQAGQHADATRLCKKVLKVSPGHPGTWYLLGVASHRSGRRQAAIKQLSKSLQNDAANADVHNYLGIVLAEAGRRQDAEKSFARAVQRNPNFPEAHNNLGNARMELGRVQDATANYRSALALRANYAEALNRLGCALKELGELEEAADCFRKAIAGNYDRPEVHAELGHVLYQLGRTDEAVQSFRSAVSMDLDSAKAHNDLGFILLEARRPAEAAVSIRKAIEIDPEIARAHNDLGYVFMDLEQQEEAIASFSKAVEIEPRYAEAHNNLGFALTETGRLEEAAASFRAAIAADPHYAPAHRHLAHIVKHTGHDDDIRAMEELFEKPGVSDDYKTQLAFGLGKAFEDLREYDRAFEYLNTANALHRKTFDFDIENWRSHVETLKRVFDAEFFHDRHTESYSDETPLFIVGMLRSGTTLVEQILASHSDVYGAGELTTLASEIVNLLGTAKLVEGIASMDDGSLKKLGEAYTGLIREKSEEARFITDKLPGNFEHVGIIKAALPNAKVIHCKRNPLDNCLSIYKNFFPRKDHKYAYDLAELGAYYSLYSELMDHWHEVLPGFVYDIRYEDVVADQEGQTSALLAHCGLEWDDACLQFHKADRPVRTVSAAQVRAPIYRDSVELWKRYEKQLRPLVEALE